jgi:hypothetical protein
MNNQYLYQILDDLKKAQFTHRKEVSKTIEIDLKTKIQNLTIIVIRMYAIAVAS